MLILAGCGGSAQPQQRTVQGTGFLFAAPAGWKVTAAKAKASAAHDSELLQVTVFPLLRPYTDDLFARVKKELDARMRTVASQEGGTITGSRTVTAAGSRAHSYEVRAGESLLRYTFVLRGRREFELLCRRPASANDDACDGLLRSFAPA